MPLSLEYGTYKTVKARFWPWLSGKGLKASPKVLRGREMGVHSGRFRV